MHDGPVGATLIEATETLRGAGNESSRLDAEVLLAHVLGRDRAYLLGRPERLLTTSERDAFAALVARRARGEPVAYLMGRRDWYDLTLRVTPDVLVPRPETEGLLERALAWSRGRDIGAAVDVGTGSGALAIALARALPSARVYALDASPEALRVARENRDRVDPTLPVTFLQGDLLAPLPERVDLIVANVPYVGAEEYEGLARDVRLYEPRQALVGGPQGHELIARLLTDAPARLHPDGAIFLELGPAQAGASFAAAQTAFPRARVELSEDYAGLMRYLAVET